MQETKIRKPRAAIRRHRRYNFSVAPPDKHIGYDLIYRVALGDREEVLLTFCGGISHQGLIIEPTELP